MAAFGTFTLFVAFVIATYAGAASLVGARRRSDGVVRARR